MMDISENAPLYQPEDGRRYRMPVVFGPSAGPRAGPDGRAFDDANAQRRTVAVSFLTDLRALSQLLAPGLELVGEPVVTVEWTELTALRWLAGRGYRMLGVKFNCRYRGQRDEAVGPFLAVLWENRPEPIITGREELGFAKLYCELHSPRHHDGHEVHVASWDSHAFLRLDAWNLKAALPPLPRASDPASGTLHYRYIPRVGRDGQAQIAEVALTPAGGCDIHYDSHCQAEGRVEFVRSTWEQLPTMYHIVNALAALPMREWRGATVSATRGAKDLSDQRVLF